MSEVKNNNIFNNQCYKKTGSACEKINMLNSHTVSDFDDFLATFTDEELISAIRIKPNAYVLDFLMKKYTNFVRFKTRSYFLIGADREDIIQEGMIGLYKAIRDFQNDKFASFRSFAELCITRQIITAVKTSTRQKHIPLNSYISINKQIYDDSDRTLLDILSEAYASNPEELMINYEECLTVESKVKSVLSKLEWQVFISYLSGNSYKEIAIDLNRHMKSIDNALQRIKHKLGQYIANSPDKEDDLSKLIYGTNFQEYYQNRIS